MYLVGNWKMTGSRAFLAAYLPQVQAVIRHLQLSEIHTVIHCPPALWLDQAVQIAANSGLHIGAQNCHDQVQGAYTGEISAIMLREIGCRYVILGHSERRAMHHENNHLIAQKAGAAARAGLTPILCIGETHRERQTGDYLHILHHHLAELLAQTRDLHSLIVAYEPIWAIGSGLTPSAAQIDEVCSSLRQHLEADGVAAPAVLYGGSVKASNCADIFSIPSVGGVLVGGASTDLQEWTDIMKAAIRIRSD